MAAIDRVLYKDGFISCRRMKMKGHIQYIIGVFVRLQAAPRSPDLTTVTEILAIL